MRALLEQGVPTQPLQFVSEVNKAVTNVVERIRAYRGKIQIKVPGPPAHNGGPPQPRMVAVQPLPKDRHVLLDVAFALGAAAAEKGKGAMAAVFFKAVASEIQPGDPAYNDFWLAITHLPELLTDVKKVIAAAVQALYKDAPRRLPPPPREVFEGIVKAFAIPEDATKGNGKYSAQVHEPVKRYCLRAFEACKAFVNAFPREMDMLSLLALDAMLVPVQKEFKELGLPWTGPQTPQIWGEVAKRAKAFEKDGDFDEFMRGYGMVVDKKPLREVFDEVFPTIFEREIKAALDKGPAEFWREYRLWSRHVRRVGDKFPLKERDRLQRAVWKVARGDLKKMDEALAEEKLLLAWRYFVHLLANVRKGAAETGVLEPRFKKWAKYAETLNLHVERFNYLACCALSAGSAIRLVEDGSDPDQLMTPSGPIPIVKNQPMSTESHLGALPADDPLLAAVYESLNLARAQAEANAEEGAGLFGAIEVHDKYVKSVREEFGDEMADIVDKLSDAKDSDREAMLPRFESIDSIVIGTSRASPINRDDQPDDDDD